jgi:hypothetical protein
MPRSALRPSVRVMVPFDRYDGWLLLAAAVYLYVSLFATPSTPYQLGGDQVFFWMYGLRLLDGQNVYRDFFQFTPPGTDLLYLSAFKLFGARLWVPNVVVLLLGTSLAFVCLRSARQITDKRTAALALAFYLVFVIGLTLNGTHHLFSLLLVMIAVLVLLRGETTARIAIAGCLLGAATFFTQTRGPVVALAVAAWLMWLDAHAGRGWPARATRVGWLIAPLVLSWGVLSSHYISTLGLKNLWFFQVSYVHAYKVSGWTLGLPDHFSKDIVLYLVRWIFAYLALPIVFVLSLWRCRVFARDGSTERVRPVLLLVQVGAALFAEVAVSPSWFRFFCISLPGVVLLAWLLEDMGKYRNFTIRVLWIGVVSLACMQIAYAHWRFSAVANLPAGTIATPPQAAEKLIWLAAHTRPRDYLFQAEWPGVYLPLELRNPAYLDVVASEGANDLGYLALATRELEDKRVRYIVESPAFAVPQFHEYLETRYRLVHTFPDRDEVWERKSEDAVISPPINDPPS